MASCSAVTQLISGDDMSTTFESIEAEVLNLPNVDRSRLLDRLIASLDTDRDIDDAWMREVKLRDEEIDSGALEALSMKAVLAKLRDQHQ